MAFRELTMMDVKEVLRRWQAEHSERRMRHRGLLHRRRLRWSRYLLHRRVVPGVLQEQPGLQSRRVLRSRDAPVRLVSVHGARAVRLGAVLQRR